MGYIKEFIKKEIKTILENKSSDWDTLYSWLETYARNSNDAKTFLSKNNIISGIQLQKQIENNNIDIAELDSLIKNPSGQGLSDLPLFKRVMSLDEESATGAIGVGAGPITTPNWVAPKGQKKNKATQTAEKQGFKKASGMPKNSKILDYKELWPGKKSSMNETLNRIIKEELLNEVTYHKFKNEVKFRTKNEQLHKAIREVKRKLTEIDRIVEYTSRMKQELSEGEEGLKYWKNTEKNISTISEMVNNLNDKIKNLK